jgi:SAM-dependent methyltransferase
VKVRGEYESRAHAAAFRKRAGPAAPENSFHIKAFYRVLPAVSGFARRRRMERLIRMLNIKAGTRVLDLGGSPVIWENVPIPLDVTVLNLPGGIPSFELQSFDARTSIHTFHFFEGDACNATQFADHSFDLAFSNSVIEHVGPQEKQKAFAREVLRIGKSYWVQTPSPWFPIEAHTGMPFYWFYPIQIRESLMRRSRRKLPTWWNEYVAETRVLSRRQMSELFPNARMYVEFLGGFPKSYAAYSLPSP